MKKIFTFIAVAITALTMNAKSYNFAGITADKIFVDLGSVGTYTMNEGLENEQVVPAVNYTGEGEYMNVSINGFDGISIQYKSASNKNNILRFTNEYLQFNGKNGIIVISDLMPNTIISLTVSAKGNTPAVFSSPDESVTADYKNPTAISSEDGVMEIKFRSNSRDVQIKETDGGFRLYKIVIEDYSVTTNVLPKNSGLVNCVYDDNKTKATLTAIPNEGYHFVLWNDGIKTNPRTIVLTQDTTFTAIFAEDEIVLPQAQAWPVIMDTVTFEMYQENIVGDFRYNGVDNNLWIWASGETYQQIENVGFNYFGNTEGYLSLRVAAPDGWSGAGFDVANTKALKMMRILRDSIVAHPNDYYLHIAIKSTDQASHEFRLFGNQPSFTIGTTPVDQGAVIGDFLRDGEWHSLYIPLASYANTIATVNLDVTDVNIFCFLSGSAVGAVLNLDAVYFCNTAFKELEQEQKCTPYSYAVKLNDDNMGRVATSYSGCPKNELYINAVPRNGYRFVQWSDGVKENPRTIVLTQDTTIIAEFAIDATGYSITFLGKDGGTIDSGILSFNVPDAPEIEGFVFLRWEILSGNLEDGFKIQAIYEAEELTSAPAVYTNPSNPAQKLIREGNVYILTGGNTYTIHGQKVR